MKLHLATLYNYNILVRLVPRRSGILNHADNVHTIDNLAKHHVLAVQKRSRDGSDKELAAIRVGPRVLPHPVSTPSPTQGQTGKAYRHAQQPGPIVRHLEVLIGKLLPAVNGGTSGAIPIDKVPSLDHKVLDLDPGFSQNAQAYVRE